MLIEMVAPDPTSFQCDTGELSALFSGSGGPLNKLRAVTVDTDYTRIELEFELVHLSPQAAHRLILDEVRRRASMHPRLARWVIRTLPSATDAVVPDMPGPVPLELGSQLNP